MSTTVYTVGGCAEIPTVRLLCSQFLIATSPISVCEAPLGPFPRPLIWVCLESHISCTLSMCLLPPVAPLLPTVAPLQAWHHPIPVSVCPSNIRSPFGLPELDSRLCWLGRESVLLPAQPTCHPLLIQETALRIGSGTLESWEKS